jgi:hypothetical protein
MEYMSMWAGQGAPMSRSLAAAELVRRLAAEAEAEAARADGSPR